MSGRLTVGDRHTLLRDLTLLPRTAPARDLEDSDKKMRIGRTITVVAALASNVAAIGGFDFNAQISLLGKTLKEHQEQHQPDKKSSRPNIIFVLTDDQDVHMNSLDHIPLIKERLIDQGTLYKRHFCTTAVCCPSRASLWTGKLAHNTNVTDLFPPYGGFPIFVKNGHNENYLPVWLQDAGYKTFYAGKMFNAHTIWNYDSPHLKGWTGSDFLLDPSTYDYWNATFQRNKQAPVNHEGEYSTDVLASKAHINSSNLVGDIDDLAPGVKLADYPQAAARHRHLFKDAKVPRTESFNPDKPSGADWIRRQPKLSEANIEYNDGHYRGRLQALQAVDELVDGLFERLEKHGILDNTYIFYTTDNGAWSTEGAATEAVTAHVDLVPTILTLAGAPLKADLDGSPIPLFPEEFGSEAALRREHVNVEYWGWAAGEGLFGFNGVNDTKIQNNTYKALRVVGGEEGNRYNLYYSVWCTNEHELYDMTNDPGQLTNLLHPDEAEAAVGATILGFPLSKVISRLDSLLLVLKSCKGSTCSLPWKSLHPEGDVTSLREALSPVFDQFYETQTRVEWSWCNLGHVVAAEGPQFETDGHVYWKGTGWSEWT
uniref:Arylsulfatase n=1 Tax=Bionectria ochroleuca TaxID=29856 RepID=A0A8H7NB98_BIOOC